MSESSTQLRERLVAEGGEPLWEAFKGRRQELVAGGMSKGEAWEKARLEFTPAKQDAPSGDQTSVRSPMSGRILPLAPASTFSTQRSTSYQNVEWVAQNIAIEDVNPLNAPSASAYALLRWVCLSPAHESTFWNQIYPKLLSTRVQGGGEGMQMDDGSSLDDLDARILGSQPKAEAVSVDAV